MDEGHAPSNTPSPPSADQITEYWKGVVGVPETCDSQDQSVLDWKRELGNLPPPSWEGPEPAVWKSAMRKAKSWRAPGNDGIYTFWWKTFKSAAVHLWEIIGGILDGDAKASSMVVRPARGHSVRQDHPITTQQMHGQ